MSKEHYHSFRQHLFDDHTGDLFLHSLVLFFSFISLILMTLPTPQQPNIRFHFPDQRSITSCLFDLILETVVSHEELECSWEIIARDIEIQEQREVIQRQAHNFPPH